jgi:hypothetical protein
MQVEVHEISKYLACFNKGCVYVLFWIGSMSTPVRDGKGSIVGVLQAINKANGFDVDGDTRR